MVFRFCPKCHKVFYWFMESQAPHWCPNCSDWIYHNKGEDASYPDSIILKPIYEELKV